MKPHQHVHNQTVLAFAQTRHTFRQTASVILTSPADLLICSSNRPVCTSLARLTYPTLALMISPHQAAQNSLNFYP